MEVQLTTTNGGMDMPDNYCTPCGSSHCGPVNEKCPVHKRIIRSALSTKITTKSSVKADMAMALVKE